ncbi:hypothetical protein JHN63_12150 [Streptomyces sp. MBT65]|uniref:hypothetical protein n=1 Tax=Streptomyces sp. MBT65 TaxID=1488395 RepID=UPI00190980F0|nr:hypothetical protein [Streptomyces sp. MBT65]MBK3574554.1 hypothetical protein [Streptomyces sp. MBT65]
MTSVHLQPFPAAHPPEIPAVPALGLPWALAEAQTFHLRGLGRLARVERAAAKQRAQQDASVYLAAESARLEAVCRRLSGEAQEWWQALVSNDEATVCEAVNTAFSDNPAAGCAVGMDGSVLSVVMRQQDLDSLPTQTAGLTPNGRPTLKNLTKRDRLLWWLTTMGSNLVATLKEGFATAPGVTAIDLAVLTRLPNTQRLGGANTPSRLPAPNASAQVSCHATTQAPSLPKLRVRVRFSSPALFEAPGLWPGACAFVGFSCRCGR